MTQIKKSVDVTSILIERVFFATKADGKFSAPVPQSLENFMTRYGS
jgi:hypothetical protein